VLPSVRRDPSMPFNEAIDQQSLMFNVIVNQKAIEWQNVPVKLALQIEKKNLRLDEPESHFFSSTL
jgi:hypothetical protein